MSVRRPPEPTWKNDFRYQLWCLNAYYLAVYNAWDRDLEREAKPKELCNWLRKRGCKWVPSVITMRRWLREIRDLENDFVAQLPAASDHQ